MAFVVNAYRMSDVFGPASQTEAAARAAGDAGSCSGAPLTMVPGTIPGMHEIGPNATFRSCFESSCPRAQVLYPEAWSREADAEARTWLDQVRVSRAFEDDSRSAQFTLNNPSLCGASSFGGY